jgi:hypothetical protein
VLTVHGDASAAAKDKARNEGDCGQRSKPGGGSRTREGKEGGVRVGAGREREWKSGLRDGRQKDVERVL